MGNLQFMNKSQQLVIFSCQWIIWNDNAYFGLLMTAHLPRFSSPEWFQEYAEYLHTELQNVCPGVNTPVAKYGFE